MKFKLAPMRHVHSDALEVIKVVSMTLGVLFIYTSVAFFVLYTWVINPNLLHLAQPLQLRPSDAFDLWVTFVYSFCGGVAIVLISFLIAAVEHRYCDKHCPVELSGV